ncbi:MAG: hypothetical protein QOE99_96 [Actinomycetota bacterium]|jgi:uncharacterized membrane protein YphA (DoxX/SURF4 family)|nr:hypothetical protein [Actinomycetota bacterium]
MTPTALPPVHETWFVHHPEDFPVRWEELRRPSVLIGLALVVVVTVSWRLAARRMPTPELPQLRGLARFVPWVPRLLAIHLGASLLLLAFDRAVLDPSVIVPNDPAHTLLLLPEVLAGLLLLTGYAVPFAASLVILAGPVLWWLAGTRSLLSCLALLGIAVFLTLVPPRPSMGGRARLDTAHLRPAVLALRVGTAGTLITLALVEKLANPAMAHAMLVQKPLLDILSPIGVGPDAFATFAGCVEVLFALLVLSGAAPQVVALVAAVPFTATLFVFGGTELIGHLPVYGVLLTLLVLGSRAATSGELSRLPFPGSTPAQRRSLAQV